MPISFNPELTNALAPHHYIEFDNSGAYEGLAGQKQTLLIVDVFTPPTPPAAPPTEPVTEATTANAATRRRTRNRERATELPAEAVFCSEANAAKPDCKIVLERFKVALEAKNNAAPATETYLLQIPQQADASAYKAALEAAIPEESYTQIALLEYDQAVVAGFKGLLKARWERSIQLDGHLFVAKAGTKSDLAPLAEALNSPHITIIPLKSDQDNAGQWASAIAAMNAAYATTPSRPYQNLKVSMLKTKAEEGFRLTERNLLLAAGVSTWRKNGSDIIIDRLVTTYTKNNAGADDSSYRDLNTLQTLSFLRFDFRTAIALAFPRHMLAKDDFPYEGPVVTPKVARMFAVARYRQWQRNNLVQDPGGEFAKRLRVEVSENTPGKLDFYLPVHVMGQWRVTQTSIAFKI